MVWRFGLQTDFTFPMTSFIKNLLHPLTIKSKLSKIPLFQLRVSNTAVTPTCKILDCMNTIIAHRPHISVRVVRKSFIAFSRIISSFFHKPTKDGMKKKRLQLWCIKKEVISTTELIRDGKIAITLVLIRLHYFLTTTK